MLKGLIGIVIVSLSIQSGTVLAEPVRVGVSFSQIQCGYFDQDWKKVYADICDMKSGMMRLGAYWSRIETEEGKYDFTNLDWLIDKAEASGIPVTLTVGMKAPRWPEYFIPDWVFKRARLRYGADIGRNKYIRERVIRFINAVISRYRHREIIQYWQVENEPLNPSGPNRWWINKKFLKEEIDLVKTLDQKKRPVIVTVATFPNRLLRLLAYLISPHNPIRETIELCDIVGYNVYPTVGHRFSGINVCFWTRPEERITYFRSIASLAESKKKRVWITELQAEPWEPGQLVHLLETNAITCWPEDFGGTFKEFEPLGIDTVLLWGAEYWHYRKTKFGDKSWWQTALYLFKGMSISLSVLCFKVYNNNNVRGQIRRCYNRGGAGGDDGRDTRLREK